MSYRSCPSRNLRYDYSFLNQDFCLLLGDLRKFVLRRRCPLTRCPHDDRSTSLSPTPDTPTSLLKPKDHTCTTSIVNGIFSPGPIHPDRVKSPDPSFPSGSRLCLLSVNNETHYVHQFLNSCVTLPLCLHVGERVTYQSHLD